MENSRPTPTHCSSFTCLRQICLVAISLEIGYFANKKERGGYICMINRVTHTPPTILFPRAKAVATQSMPTAINAYYFSLPPLLFCPSFPYCCVLSAPNLRQSCLSLQLSFRRAHPFFINIYRLSGTQRQHFTILSELMLITLQSLRAVRVTPRSS